MSTAEQQTLNYAQQRLAEWGQWQRNLPGNHIGYPRRAPYTVSRIDNDQVANDIPMNENTNAAAEELEAIMCRLNQCAPQLYRALSIWYISSYSQADAAKQCQCSTSMYRNRLRTGEMWVAAKLLG